MEKYNVFYFKNIYKPYLGRMRGTCTNTEMEALNWCSNTEMEALLGQIAKIHFHTCKVYVAVSIDLQYALHCYCTLTFRLSIVLCPLLFTMIPQYSTITPPTRLHRNYVCVNWFLTIYLKDSHISTWASILILMPLSPHPLEISYFGKIFNKLITHVLLSHWQKLDL